MRRELESSVVHAVRIVNLDGVVLWVNRVGFAQPLHSDRPLWFGLPEGSADLIGICDGRFISIEVKRPGRDTTSKQRREKQRLWRELVKAKGGFATVVRSDAEYVAAIARCRNGDAE